MPHPIEKSQFYAIIKDESNKLTKRIIKMGKTSKIFGGIGIATMALFGAKKANAQEIDEYGVANMTEAQKTERLAEIKIELDSILKVVEWKKENYDLVSEFITERFPMEEYSKRGWGLPVGAYIRDDIFKNIDTLMNQTKDSVEQEKIKKDKELLIEFFQNKINDLTATDWSTRFAASVLTDHVRYMTTHDSLPEKDRDIILSYLNPYLNATGSPKASKYETIYTELTSMFYSDLSDLGFSYKNGEINPDEYAARKTKMERTYNLMIRLLKAANKNKKLSDAPNMYRGIMELKHLCRMSYFTSDGLRKQLLEEQNAILMPPVEKQPENKKKGGRHAFLSLGTPKVH